MSGWRANGGYLGPRPTGPSASVASGWWDSRSQFRNRRDSLWPANGDPFWADVQLLLPMDSTFADVSQNAFSVTPISDAQISSAQSKFGGASGLFVDADDRLEISSNAALSFGTGSFAVEFWIRFTSIAAAAQNLVNVNTSGGFSLYVNGPSGFFGNANSVVVSNRSANQLVRSWTPNTAQWYHVAVTRDGSTMRLFIDGVQQGASVTATTNYGQATMQIGGGPDGQFTGHIDDLRITKGQARHIANYTVAESAFPRA